MSGLSPNDPSSYSRPEYVVIRHVSLDLDVNFVKKILKGTALLKLEALQDIDEVVLDVSNQTIHSVELENGTSLNFKVDGHIANLGSRLTITLPNLISPPEKEDLIKILSYGHAFAENRKADNELKSSGISKNVGEHSAKPMTFTFDAIEGADSCQSCKCEDDHNKRRAANAAPMHDVGKVIDDAKTQDDAPKGIRTGIDVNISYEARFNIRIKYETSPTASALQWLDPNQTSGKDYPYMFSQCQPIHARSILPCQDTPAVKFTYDAVVTAPEMFTVLMSAIRDQKKINKTNFNQPVPVPSYLLAIAVGVLDSKRLGPRTVVWSEKEEIERSSWEFAETEKFLVAAESLCGPYVWSVYDLLVLPPSFPYGGMENPCLTFVTPTLLSGDRSQADVIVHEIMHSWTGNLVTNKNFEHFWLNEGFTVFLERKVAASLIADPAEAKKSRDFHSLLGLQELTEAVKEQFTPNDPLTRLVPDLKGVHPDDAFSRVPYEKGSLFLRYLEDMVGGPEVFDAFLRSYLDHFQRKSLDTDQFKAYLLSYFKGTTAEEKLNAVDWHAWLHTPGMPPVIPGYDTSMTQAVRSLLNKIYDVNTTLSKEDIAHFTPHQIINLMQEMLERTPLTIDRVENLGSEYKIAQSQNAEIKYRWLRLNAKCKNLQRLPEILQFVNEQGRMKFVRPIYRDLYAWEEVRQQAIDNFLNNEKFMMHVSAYTIRKDLHLSE